MRLHWITSDPVARSRVRPVSGLSTGILDADQSAMASGSQRIHQPFIAERAIGGLNNGMTDAIRVSPAVIRTVDPTKMLPVRPTR